MESRPCGGWGDVCFAPAVGTARSTRSGTPCGPGRSAQRQEYEAQLTALRQQAAAAEAERDVARGREQALRERLAALAAEQMETVAECRGLGRAGRESGDHDPPPRKVVTLNEVATQVCAADLSG